MNPIHEEIARRMDGIESELRRLGRWSETTPSPEDFESDRAFFGDKMAIETWVQFVLIPRVRKICAEDGEFPPESSVGAYAIRQLDGDDDAARLCSLLSAFDEFIEQPPAPEELEALGAARRYFDALLRGDADAARAELAESSRDAEGAELPPITAYHPGLLGAHGDGFALGVELLGESKSGPEDARMALLLVREAGTIRIDLLGTLALMFDSFMDDAMPDDDEDDEDEEEDSYAATRREETREAIDVFERDHAPKLAEEIAGALGRPLPLSFDFEAVADGFDDFFSLTMKVQNFAVALRAMDSSARARAAEAASEVRVRVVADPAEKGVRIGDGAIELVLAPAAGGGAYDYPITARLLELQSDEDLGPRQSYVAGRATEWWKLLRDERGLPAVLEVDWQRFTGSRDPGAVAWALFLLPGLGLDPVCDSLSNLLEEDETFAATVRDSLRRILFQPTWGDQEPEISREEDVLMVTIRAEEGAPTLGTPEEVRARLHELLA